ncbi:MAG: hypothetical protein R3A13_09585 [Bdellovibrionota bacterium]
MNTKQSYKICPLHRFFHAVCFFCLFTPSISFSEGENNHQHYEHHSNGLEIGLSVEYVYLDEGSEDEVHHEEEHEEHDSTESVAGLHAHIIKSLGDEGIQKNLGLGIGGEILFTDDPHYGLMASLAIYPWSEWLLMLSPGVEIAKHEGSYENKFVMHYEISYGFEFDNYHIGPAIGFAHTQDTKHYSAGIHIGF